MKTTITPGKRKDLVSSSVLKEAISFGFLTAPMGGFYGLSHGFWFATPAQQAVRKIGIKTAVWGLLGASYQGSATLLAGIRGKNDSFNQGFGGLIAGALAGLGRSSLSHASLYATVFATTAYFVTETLDTYHEETIRKVEPGEGRKLPGFLVHEHDPFASRIAQMKMKQETEQ